MSYHRAVWLGLLALLPACSDGPSGPLVTGVRMVGAGPASVKLPPGVALTIKVEVLDSNFNPLATPPRTAFTWVSSDPAVATVSRDGVVRVQDGALANAAATIRVGYETAFNFVNVLVAAPPVALHLDPPALTLTPGAEFTLMGLAENPQGGLEHRHLFDFTLSAGAAIGGLSAAGCAGDECISADPDAVTVRTTAPGIMKILAKADGRSAEANLVVRTISFTGVITGGGHSCGATTDGLVFCWGDGYLRTPVQVAIPAGVSNLRAGTTRTCGIDAGGHAFCWPNSPAPSPELLSATVSFTDLSIGPGSSCGLGSSGAAWCWGHNAWGQLGDGTQNPSSTPVAVAGGLQFQQIAASWGDDPGHACGLTSTGEAYCWGANNTGQLGNPSITQGCAQYGCSAVPVRAAEGHLFTQIVTGAAHTCGLQADGAAWCWGSGGTLPVAGGHTFKLLTAGATHTCGLTAAGEAYCWGANPDGRTGQPPVDGPPGFGQVYPPTLVSGGRTYTVLAAGGGHTCGLAPDGLYCWGDNGSGQVGVLGGISTQQPIRVTGQP